MKKEAPAKSLERIKLKEKSRCVSCLILSSDVGVSVEVEPNEK